MAGEKGGNEEEGGGVGWRERRNLYLPPWNKRGESREEVNEDFIFDKTKRN